MDGLIVATGNAHKVSEIREILGSGVVVSASQEMPGAPSVTEDAPTFAGNAVKKASHLAGWMTTSSAGQSALARWLAAHPEVDRLWVLADDSGLEVDALGGAPGVFSARFAALDGNEAGGGNAPDSANNAKLLRLLQGLPLERRTARFRCAIALLRVGRETRPERGHAEVGNVSADVFEGTCEGVILEDPRGSAGFGYDSLFVPAGLDGTFAQLGEAVKHQLSHRGKALRLVQTFLRPATSSGRAEDRLA